MVEINLTDKEQAILLTLIREKRDSIQHVLKSIEPDIGTYTDIDTFEITKPLSDLYLKLCDPPEKI